MEHSIGQHSTFNSDSLPKQKTQEWAACLWSLCHLCHHPSPPGTCAAHPGKTRTVFPQYAHLRGAVPEPPRRGPAEICMRGAAKMHTGQLPKTTGADTSEGRRGGLRSLSTGPWEWTMSALETSEQLTQLVQDQEQAEQSPEFQLRIVARGRISGSARPLVFALCPLWEWYRCVILDNHTLYMWSM